MNILKILFNKIRAPLISNDKTLIRRAEIINKPGTALNFRMAWRYDNLDYWIPTAYFERRPDVLNKL